MKQNNKALRDFAELYIDFVAERDAPHDFDSFISWTLNQYNTMSDEITGYYIDLPEGAQGISVNGAEQVPIANYTDGIVVAETPTHYGTIEWVEYPGSVEVDGAPVDVQPLIAGHHPVARPK